MYIKHGKVKFSSSDTFDLCETLKPIIYAGLIKFKDSQRFEGVNDKLIRECVDRGLILNSTGELSDEELEVVLIEQHSNFDKMLYAFGTEEPDIDDYEFKIDLVELGTTPEGFVECDTVCSNEKGIDRYRIDIDSHNTKCQEGYELFGKYFSSLWW